MTNSLCMCSAYLLPVFFSSGKEEAKRGEEEERKDGDSSTTTTTPKTTPNNNSAAAATRTNSPHSSDCGQLSPPTYSVESDSQGNWFSSKYQVHWPDRPRKGKHSRRVETKLRYNRRHRMSSSASAAGSEGSDGGGDTFINNKKRGEEEGGGGGGRVCCGCDGVVRTYKIAVCPKEAPLTYEIRQMRMEEAKLLFDKCHLRNFMIYYLLPREKFTNAQSIPLELPLVIAYKSENNKVIHMQVKCYTCSDYGGDEEMWCAVRLSSNGSVMKENVRFGFSSVRALIDYYCYMNACCQIGCHTKGK